MKRLLFAIYFLSFYTAALPRSSVIGHLLSDQNATTLNRNAFYKAMRDDNKALVNAQITELQTAPSDISEAFLGAMMMKKAGLGGSPSARLKLFKQGRKMLENAIRKDPDNAEYRFLRLMVQEHAPGILKYKDDMTKDSEYIKKSYKSLPVEVQEAMTDYSKKSKYLKLEVS